MPTEPEGRLIEQGYGWAVRVRDDDYNWREFLVTGHGNRDVAEIAAKAKWPKLYVLSVEPLGFGQVRAVEQRQWFPLIPQNDADMP